MGGLQRISVAAKLYKQSEEAEQPLNPSYPLGNSTKKPIFGLLVHGFDKPLLAKPILHTHVLGTEQLDYPSIPQLLM